jgi:uncharacterized protein YvpB
MKAKRSFAVWGLALAAVMACADSSLQPTKAVATPVLLGTGAHAVVYKPATITQVKATDDFRSKVGLRLSAAANRDAVRATSLPDSESPRTLNRKAVPTAPGQFTVTAGIEAAKVSWAAPLPNGFGLDSYTLVYEPGDVAQVLDPANLSADLKDLKGDTEYTFTVQASNAFGDSVPATTKATIQSPPPPPPPAPEYIAPVASSAGQWSGTHVISGVPFYRQTHNLSCEETAVSMALTHQGMYVSQDQILGALGVDNTPPVVQNGVLVSWGNPDRAFVGNVNGLERNFTGYQANPKALMRVINGFGGRVIEWGEPGVAGYVSPQEIYAQVMADHPVVAYATWDWAWHPRHDYRSEDGNMVAWIGPYDAHVYTVVGVSPWSVLVNDPIRGQYWVSKGSFEAAYSDFNMAIVFP